METEKMRILRESLEQCANDGVDCDRCRVVKACVRRWDAITELGSSPVLLEGLANLRKYKVRV